MCVFGLKRHCAFFFPYKWWKIWENIGHTSLLWLWYMENLTIHQNKRKSQLQSNSYLQIWKKCHFSKIRAKSKKRETKHNEQRRNEELGSQNTHCVTKTRKPIGLISMCWCGEIDSALRHCRCEWSEKEKLAVLYAKLCVDTIDNTN